MSRRLLPLSHRRGFHRRSRWQRWRIGLLMRELSVMNMCARLYVACGHAPTMMVQDVLTDIVPRFERLRAEVEGLRGFPLGAGYDVGRQLARILENPPKF